MRGASDSSESDSESEGKELESAGGSEGREQPCKE